MTSVNTNIAAMTALRTLQTTNAAMEQTQSRVSTGLKVGEAKDNAAYWAISTSLKSDNKSLSTVKDALNLGAATVDIAYEAQKAVKDTLNEIKNKLILAQTPNVNLDTIQKEIKDLQANLKSIAEGASFSNENWLSVDSSLPSFTANKQVVSSFTRDASGGIQVGTIDVDISKGILFDANANATTKGILDTASTLLNDAGKKLSIGGTAAAGNTNAAGLGTMAVVGGKVNVATASTITAGTVGSTLEATGSAVATGSYASFETDVLTLTGDAAIKKNDKITFQIRLDGQNISTYETGAIAAAGDFATGAEIAKALEDAMGASTAPVVTSPVGYDMEGRVAVTFESNGKLRFTVKDGAAGASTGVDSSLAVTSFLNTTVATSKLGGTAGGSGIAGTAVTDTDGTDATKGKITSAAMVTDGGAATDIDYGDALTFSLNVDGLGSQTLSVTVTGGTGDASRANILASINTAIAADSNFRGKVVAKLGTSGDLNKLVFESTKVGDGSSVAWGSFTNTTSSTRISGIASASAVVSNGGDSTASTYVTPALDQTVSSTSIRVGDKLTMAIKLDGATTAINVTTDAIGSTVDTLTNQFYPVGSTADKSKILSAMQDAVRKQFGADITVGLNSLDQFTFTTTTTKALDASLDVKITNASSNVRNGGISSSKLYSDHGSSSPSTSYRLTTGDVSELDRSKLANGDVVTIKYNVGGTDREAKVTLATSDLGSTSAIASKLDNAGLAGLKVQAVGSKLQFDSLGLGDAAKFSLTGISVANSDGVVKNLDLLSGFTEATNGAAKTGMLSWSNIAADDKIKLSLTVDGSARAPLSITAGASVDAFIVNLNANTEFSKYATAVKTDLGEIKIASKSTGASSAVSIDQVEFAALDGTEKLTRGTGFYNTLSKATSTSSAFSAITLDKNDTLSFSVKTTTGGTAKDVTIDQALVNATLGASAKGAVNTVADYQRVLEAGLAAAGVTGLTVAVGTGADANKLVFTNTSAQVGNTVDISNVVASSGGREISIDKIDISAAALSAAGATDQDSRKAIINAYANLVSAAIDKVTDAATNYGSVSSRIETQSKFVTTLMDTIDKGVGNLIDADITEESTRLQALQVKQQLGVQSLSLANQGAQQILRLFQ